MFDLRNDEGQGCVLHGERPDLALPISEPGGVPEGTSRTRLDRDQWGRFLPAKADPFDPRFWPEPLPYKTITLSTCGEIYTVVDADLYDELRQWQWHLYDYRGKRYAKRTATKDELAAGSFKSIYMHRYIAERYVPRPSKVYYIVDHIRGDGLDNRRAFLRWATPRDNRLNVFGLWFTQRDFIRELEEADAQQIR